MSAGKHTTFPVGVIEGFYGPPWTQAERFELFDWMSSGGLNTYLYAPKDDLKQRAIWRELYDEIEVEQLRQLVAACRQRSIEFVCAISPGLDIAFSSEADFEALQARFAQWLAMGCRNFALFFDDIPDRMSAGDAERWGSFASAQCHVANRVFCWLRSRCPELRFWFCPTPYCGRMAVAELGGKGYLQIIGVELLPEIEIFWTGPDIISREITAAHARELQSVLRRKPLIWDNLHANDYDGRRFFCGPYDGRPAELIPEINGLMINPNTEFELNFIAINTLGEFVREPRAFDPRRAYLAAVEKWLPRFSSVGKPVLLEDLVLLGDCYYLPYDDGVEAIGLLTQVLELLRRNPSSWGPEVDAVRRRVTGFRDVCARLAELRHRPLFNALSRRIWELREELDLLDRYIAFKAVPTNRDRSFISDFHRTGTYRGGFVVALQRLLTQQDNGIFDAVSH